jgi:integrase
VNCLVSEPTRNTISGRTGTPSSRWARPQPLRTRTSPPPATSTSTRGRWTGPGDTFATAKAEQDVSPYQLQEWLGHAKLATTMQYVHPAKRPNAQRVMQETSL